MPQDTTYDLITQSAAPSVHYGRGTRNRWPPARYRYHPDREIPLSCQDACRCSSFRIEVAIHRLPIFSFDPDVMEARCRDERRRVRRQALGDAGLFSTMSDRALVEFRQARALAGVDVSEYDVEITRRILADPSGWGRVGSVMRRRGWVDEVLDDGENYVLH
ncbi:hypothetical protein P171DRAFT_426969 [Karstenula rhodostoma CBS 690.94]|uniref:Uncharacterized protein n=1 Tax=Karstenula rhodostoma CBS 690.94 TaxID=1392251 RepID=A0A9P4UIT5_9PLEO|nr:hypothetical protein P171DRAFT_426969 [Karstenula rhodostoma CBS 690.94]